ncbi:MAG: GmrSD restriction endonuclease domain-containing protein [Thermodesulfovibrionales bacterium]
MSIKWKTTQYSVRDIQNLNKTLELEVRPEYQRHSVWTHAAKIMLIDSILRDIPMPKIYIHVKITPKGKTIRSVIDGQQRILAILEFISDPEFKLVEPYRGDYEGWAYNDFVGKKIENVILDYLIDINEIYTDSDKFIREIYSRVNKYTVPLNSQELRRADFPGDFLTVSEQLSSLEFFDEAKMFTAADRRRMRDVEFISELLAALMKGPQDKKESLDSFYLSLAKWKKDDKEKLILRFKAAIADIQKILPLDNEVVLQGIILKPFKKTRFRQKADFYSLLIALDELRSEGHSIENKCLDLLEEDFGILDYHIAPESEVELLSKYAIQCTSQANTIASRTWRKNLLKRILAGTYIANYPDTKTIRDFHYLLWDLYTAGCDMCPVATTDCEICGEEFNDYSEDNARLIWNADSDVFQLSNAFFIHKKCFDKKGFPDYISSASVDEDSD